MLKKVVGKFWRNNSWDIAHSYCPKSLPGVIAQLIRWLILNPISSSPSLHSCFCIVWCRNGIVDKNRSLSISKLTVKFGLTKYWWWLPPRVTLKYGVLSTSQSPTQTKTQTHLPWLAERWRVVAMKVVLSDVGGDIPGTRVWWVCRFDTLGKLVSRRHPLYFYPLSSKFLHFHPFSTILSTFIQFHPFS